MNYFKYRKLILLSVLWSLNSYAAKPSYINERFNFYGALKSVTGQLVPDGSYNIEVRLRNSSLGSPYWTKTFAGVQVRSGIFSVSIQGNDNVGVAIGDVGFFSFPNASSGLSQQADVLVDYNLDGTYDDTFLSIPLSPVPLSFVASK